MQGPLRRSASGQDRQALGKHLSNEGEQRVRQGSVGDAGLGRKCPTAKSGPSATHRFTLRGLGQTGPTHSPIPVKDRQSRRRIEPLGQMSQERVNLPFRPTKGGGG